MLISLLVQFSCAENGKVERYVLFTTYYYKIQNKTNILHPPHVFDKNEKKPLILNMEVQGYNKGILLSLPPQFVHYYTTVRYLLSGDIDTIIQKKNSLQNC